MPGPGARVVVTQVRLVPYRASTACASCARVMTHRAGARKLREAALPNLIPPVSQGEGVFRIHSHSHEGAARPHPARQGNPATARAMATAAGIIAMDADRIDPSP